MTQSFIPYGCQSIDQDDIDEVIAVLKSDYLTQGPKVSEFEDAFSKYVGSTYAVAVSNGTAALHLLNLVMGLGEGDSGITSANTFLASANSILYTGAQIKLADIDSGTYCVTLETLKTQSDHRCRVVIPVHFSGNPCDMEAIYKWAKDQGYWVIEDACHALGGVYKGSRIGSCQFSDACIFSFHPVKAIATGEGGMITTNSKELYEKLLGLRTHGVTKDPIKLTQNPGPWYYEMQSLGYNYRMTDMQAALGISQLRKLPTFVKRRQILVNQYNQAFLGHSYLTIPQSMGSESMSGNHLYVLQIDFDRIGKTRAEVMGMLRDQGIGTQVHYIPVYKQPYYQQFGFDEAEYPNTEHYYKSALSLPLYPSLSDEDQNRVIQSILRLAR